eukprot:1184628-Prorocentrum_minimum.AAC.5
MDEDDSEESKRAERGAAKSGKRAHLDETRNNGSGNGLRGVTDTQADDLSVGVLRQVLGTATPDLRSARSTHAFSIGGEESNFQGRWGGGTTPRQINTRVQEAHHLPVTYLREQVPGLELAEVGVAAHTGLEALRVTDGCHAHFTLGDDGRAAASHENHHMLAVCGGGN